MIESHLLNQPFDLQSLRQVQTLENAIRNPISLPTTSLFGTDGIRGCVGVDELLNAALALQIGFWAGQTLRANTDQLAPVILGQDSRNSSDMLSVALAEGLTTAGVEVWNLGLCPTPAVAHLTRVSEAMGGIMISASHNPPQDNGIKFFDSFGTKVSTLIQAQIEAGIRGRWDSYGIQCDELKREIIFCDSQSLGKQYYRPELIAEYVDAVRKPFQSKHNLVGMRIVLDLAWGAAVNTAPEIFKAMGAEIITLHDRPDGDRINVNCGSTHLATLQQVVKENNADLGFAFDGDADRVMAVDSHGQVVDGDYILYLWGQALRQQQMLPNNTIVSTVMANLGFENAWVGSGGKLIRTGVGDQHVHGKMVELGASLGGEQSGHILCPYYAVSGDGVLTALHLSALVKKSGSSLSQMRMDSFQSYPQLLKNIPIEDPERRLNWQECEPLQRAIAQAEASMGKEGRILVRPSGTEPLIRIMVEAANMDQVQHWSNILVTCTEKYLAV